MKKFLLLILSLLVSSGFCFAQPSNVSFIYINGSNTNDNKMTQWFIDGVHKTHKDMAKTFSSSALIQKEMLANGTKKINETAIPFYWGNLSKAEMAYLEDELKIEKIFRPHLAQSVRALIASYLHDAIWVTKYANMLPILDKLQDTIISEYQKGNSVVLFGYSAGSFVTTNYLFYKSTYIPPRLLFEKLNFSEEDKEYVKTISVKNTCLDALVDSKIVIMNNQNKLIPNSSSKIIRENYLKLDDYTNLKCTPQDALEGIVNFASPLPLFYSGSTNRVNQSIYNAFMLRYIIENHKFFLTVNYADDPLGFPVTDPARFEQHQKIWNGQISPNGGFIYDKTDVKSPQLFLTAHTSYWPSSKKFAKTVVKAYEDGFSKFYQNVFVKK